MNKEEEQIVRQFVDTLRALVTQEAIQRVTTAFINSKDTNEDMVRMAFRECKSFADQRLQARCENVLFLSKRKHLDEACRLLSQQIDSYASSRLQLSFGIDFEASYLDFEQEE